MRPCEKDHSVTDGIKRGCRICEICLDLNNEESRKYRAIWGVEEPKEPSFWQKMKNFARAGVGHILAGLPTVDEELKRERLRICEGCDQFIKDKRSCRLCGCGLEMKAGWSDQDCPIGKWPVNQKFPIKYDENNLCKGIEGYRFNSSIINYQSGYLFAFRTGWCGSEIFLMRMDKNFHSVGEPVKLDLFHGTKANYGREDPRLFYHLGKLHVSYAGVVGGHAPDHTKQLYARLDDSLRVERIFCPEYEKEQHWEKNWVFFSNQGSLFSIYSIKPHRVLRIVEDKAEEGYLSDVKLPWLGGILRGGASPFLVGEEFYHFFHDRVEDQGHRIYRMGLYTFHKDPPFHIKRMIPYPILVADRSTKPPHWYASVVFPGGAVRDKNYWYVALGIHDRWSEIHRFRVDEVEKMLVRAPMEEE